MGLKLIYTNVDGIISKRLEITDLIKEKKKHGILYGRN